MELVMGGLSALGLMVLALWGWSLRGSVERDKIEAERSKQEAEEARRQAEREARLARKGERLRCLNCEKTFRGPLPADGCPRCHLAAFVVPLAELEEAEPERKQKVD